MPLLFVIPPPSKYQELWIAFAFKGNVWEKKKFIFKYAKRLSDFRSIIAYFSYFYSWKPCKILFPYPIIYLLFCRFFLESPCKWRQPVPLLELGLSLVLLQSPVHLGDDRDHFSQKGLRQRPKLAQKLTRLTLAEAMMQPNL